MGGNLKYILFASYFLIYMTLHSICCFSLILFEDTSVLTSNYSQALYKSPKMLFHEGHTPWNLQFSTSTLRLLTYVNGELGKTEIFDEISLRYFLTSTMTGNIQDMLLINLSIWNLAALEEMMSPLVPCHRKHKQNLPPKRAKNGQQNSYVIFSLWCKSCYLTGCLAFSHW